MPRQKKDGRFINYYIDRTIFERLQRYADDKGQQMTTAIERILQEHLDQYEAERSEKGGITMKYCPNCNVLLSGSRCIICGNRNVREPVKVDFCYLAEVQPIWADALKDVLREHQIPFVTKNSLGAGLAAKMGPSMERVRFYVPYGYYQQAQELEQGFFHAE